MYSLMHIRCLVFKLNKIIGQRSFQSCTGVKISNCSDFDETYLKLFVLTLVLLRVFPKHIFLRGVVATPLGLSILKVI